MNTTRRKNILWLLEILLLIISTFLMIEKTALALPKNFYYIYFALILTLIIFDKLFMMNALHISDVVVEWLVYILRVLTIVLFIFAFVISIRVVRGSSMETTYKDGQKLFIYHLSKQIDVGDVIVFKTQENNQEVEYIKRVVAKAGDHISIKKHSDGNTYLYVNYEVIESVAFKGLYYQMEVNYLEESMIPAKYYFVVGDNLYNSNDSRESSVGLIHIDQIVGKVG